MATFNACGTTSGSTNASNGSLLRRCHRRNQSRKMRNNTTGETLGNLLGQLLNNSSTLTQDDLVGTCKYQSPDASLNLKTSWPRLVGEVAAQKIESRLTTAFGKVGIKRGCAHLTLTRTTPTALSSAAEPSTANTTFDANTKPSR